MKLLYLGGLCSDALFHALLTENPSLSQAAFKYEKQFVRHIGEGIGARKQNGDIEIISYLPESQTEAPVNDEEIDGLKYRYVQVLSGFPKGVCQAVRHASDLIADWIGRTEGMPRILVTYATNPILMTAAFRQRRRHKDLKIVTICSEVPAYRNYDYTSSLKGFLLKAIYTHFNENMDGYIFFSRYMNEVCNRRNRPWIVVEGLPQIDGIGTEAPDADPNGGGSILYAGGLDRGYGIEELLDAMSLLSHRNAKLYLCGNGTLAETVKKYAGHNPNIVYLGVMPNDKVTQLERQVSVCINPRKPDLKLTRFSFPSKTLEYMSNGFSVALISRLDGIPEEYFRHCFVLDDATPEAIASAIDRILDIPVSERRRFAGSAYDFVKNEKSAESQCRKIGGFLTEIMR